MTKGWRKWVGCVISKEYKSLAFDLRAITNILGCFCHVIIWTEFQTVDWRLILLFWAQLVIQGCLRHSETTLTFGAELLIGTISSFEMSLSFWAELWSFFEPLNNGISKKCLGFDAILLDTPFKNRWVYLWASSPPRLSHNIPLLPWPLYSSFLRLMGVYTEDFDPTRASSTSF